MKHGARPGSKGIIPKERRYQTTWTHINYNYKIITNRIGYILNAGTRLTKPITHLIWWNTKLQNKDKQMSWISGTGEQHSYVNTS